MLELISVLAIIATLASIGALGYRLALREGKASAAKAELGEIRLALEAYRVEFGRYPNELAAAAGVLTNAVEGGAWIDPWGEAYHYRSEGRLAYRIWSTGSDPADAADDIEPTKVGY